MSEYQFRLQNWHERNKSLICPRCGKGNGCYKEYVYADGTPVDPINHSCGRCDHEQSCGYIFTPKEFFELNPNEKNNVKGNIAPQKQKRRIETPSNWVTTYRGDYDNNVFVCWLKSLPWSHEKMEMLRLCLNWYCVGTAIDSRVIFWQIDETGLVRAGKLMKYYPNGHRAKKPDGSADGLGWMHAEAQKKLGKWLPRDEWEIVQCLFGQHLISYFPNAEIHIAESEKTALIMAISDPHSFDKHLWLSTGGKKLFNPNTLEHLKNKKVFAYPDIDGEAEWREIAKGYPNVTIATSWMKQITDEDPKGADIGDLIIRKMMKSSNDTLNNLCQNHPSIKTLIETLKLEICPQKTNKK